MKAKQAWWVSDWFLGGITPLFPVAALFVSAMIGLPPGETIMFVGFAALPMSALLATALVANLGEAGRGALRWLRRKH